jgi:predicted nucleic acid-binding protein
VADVLLDTTFFIDLRRGDQSATELWSQIRRREIDAGYSSVTAYELWLSSELGRTDETFFRALFSLLEEVPLTTAAAQQAAIWLRELPRRTRDRRLRDALIAASAATRRDVVYTRNIRDFVRFYHNVRSY